MHFSKMHGLGNDFMVIDAITQYVCISSETIQRLSDRHRGIGFDQLLIVEPSYNLKIDFHYRIFNADGSEVAQCGNGARCFAHFVHMKNLTNKKDIYVSTKTGHMILTVIKYGLIRVNMGKPDFHKQHILYVSNNLKKNKNIYNKKKIICNIISIGNPHCVIIVENTETAPVKTLGPLLEMHNKFPERVNIGFMQILNRRQIRLRVYERGSGETQSCGSGACAAVAIGILHGKLDENVQVEFIGGYLKINWTGPEYPIYMTGPATHVYDGFINL